MTDSPRPCILDPIWTLWVPVLAIILQIAIELYMPAEVLSGMHSEWGVHETLQVLVIFLAMIVAVSCVLRTRWGEQKWLGLWAALAALCCLYVTGEEISWGQHVFYWETSESWQAVNDQGETNLHNTSSWLDQKPRLLLFIGIVVGGLAIPALQRYAPHRLPQRFAALFPPASLWLAALLVLLPYAADKIASEFFGTVLFVRVSEMQELYMYYFVLLYLWDLRGRAFPPRLCGLCG